MQRQVSNLLPRRMEGEWMEAAFQTHENTNRTSGNLGDDVQAVVLCAIEFFQHGAPHVWCGIVLIQVHTHSHVWVSGCHLAHPRPFIGGENLVFGCELEHAATVLVHCFGNGEDFVFFSVCSGNKFAALTTVNRCAASREAKRTVCHCFVYILGHESDVFCRGGFICCATITHHECAQWAVSNLRANVDDALLCCECVHVFGE